MQKWLIALGLLLVVAGLAWPWLDRVPLGRLPGDILIRRDGMTIYIPITTMLVVSIVVSVVVWLYRR